VPALTDRLAADGADLRFGVNVTGIEPGRVHTTAGEFTAEHVVYAAGPDVDRLFPAGADGIGLPRCRLQMLEVAPQTPVTIRPGVLTGLSMLRYDALSSTTAAAHLEKHLREQSPELLDVAMNLMLTQRPDGAVVLGDTHHHALTHDPFDDEELAGLLLREGRRLLGTDLRVLRRWRGVYASSPHTAFLTAAPHRGTRVVSVTSGIGMTTAFGLARHVLSELT
jgi:FAD dependent oxidoreductase TIGR03364